jgi:DNA-binding transcriptional regulator YiaG
MSEEDFAAILGVRVETLRRWESGRQIQPRIFDNLMRLIFNTVEQQERTTHVELEVPREGDASSEEGDSSG